VELAQKAKEEKKNGTSNKGRGCGRFAVHLELGNGQQCLELYLKLSF